MRQNLCTLDVASGSGCTLSCSHPPSGTHCGECGDGVLQPGETCDNSSAAKCPTSCAPSTDACVPVVLIGSAATCSAACVAQPITRCTSGDNCCAPACSFTNDSDCSIIDPDNCELVSHTGNPTCPNSVNSCKNMTGVTGATSPMPGVSKGLLCQQIVDCIHTTRCAQNFNVTDCICGPDVASDSCFAGTFEAATGPCKDLIAAGAESNLMPVITANFSDPTFAIGGADTVIESCDYLWCNQLL